MYTPLKNSLRLLLPSAVIAAVAVSCASDECLDNKNALPLAAFFSSDTVPQKISLANITVFGIDNPYDSLLADSAASLDQIYLPFRIDEGRSSFVFDYGTPALSQYALRDTVVFTYDVSPRFVSSACGAMYFYENVRVSHTREFIDSVRIPSGHITNRNSQNIFIYFRETDEPSE